ncbi:MAG: hypothetical protein P0Y65_05555 [Candidatus Devosia phytovorans]|uniref:Uncharacterized protein n=1 Tax=Candidatus Devosia phytovorans TaxID=3121372 RepID=A0AAJ6B0H1_9HYPH|nr:hypothetical protein [Devosia sp.]WEK05720.1 MAG: hypothetical protein P0Y65_05555 [Devosia sp.]
MTRPAAFTQGDISKLLKGAKAAGVSVKRVVIDRTGRIVADFGETVEDATAPTNEWDVVFDAQEKRTAKGRH